MGGGYSMWVLLMIGELVGRNIVIANEDGGLKLESTNRQQIYLI